MPDPSVVLAAVTPAEHFLNWQQDPYSNYVARLTFPEQVREFRIEIDLVAEMSVYNPFDFFLEPRRAFPFTYEPGAAGLQPFLRADAATPRFAAYLSSRLARAAGARSTSSSI